MCHAMGYCLGKLSVGSINLQFSTWRNDMSYVHIDVKVHSGMPHGMEFVDVSTVH